MPVTAAATASGTVSRMLLITVHEWPDGDGGRARLLARMGIANVTDLADVSGYVYMVEDRDGMRSGVVHRHRRSDGFWPLIARAARAATVGQTHRLSNTQRRVAEEIGRRLLAVDDQ